MIKIDRAILAAAKVQTVELCYRAGEPVYERGASAQFVYVVDEGALFRFLVFPGDRRSIRQFLFSGDCFGYEIGRHYRDTVRALTHIKVLAVAKEALLAAASSDLRLSNRLFNAEASAAVIADEQADALRVKTATERIAQFLLDMEARLSIGGEIDLPMRRRDIADYFGLTEETICRAFRALRQEKIIHFREREQLIVIRDKQRLQRLASDASDFDYWSVLKKRKTVRTVTAVQTSPASTARSH